MPIRRAPLLVLLLTALAGISASAGADTWESNLKGGGVVRIDPVTRKPTLFYNGGSSLLWDGVHEMEDGSVITIRDGVAVPDETMFSTWSREAPREPGAEAPFCEQLVRKVCGFHSECAGERPCYLARELSRLERSETRGALEGLMAPSSVECKRGLADTVLFPGCERAAADKITPCIKLVAKVCGDQGQCSSAPACGPARQLLVMEREERLENRDPDAVTDSGMQCQEALGNSFFKRCK